jgi:hypothetical protein
VSTINPTSRSPLEILREWCERPYKCRAQRDSRQRHPAALKPLLEKFKIFQRRHFLIGPNNPDYLRPVILQ